MRRLLTEFILTCVLSAYAILVDDGAHSLQVQTNLRQTDASLDPNRLIDQLSDMRANVLLVGMGGIAAYYPTEAGYHYASPFLAPGPRHVWRRPTRSSCPPDSGRGPF